MALRSCGDDECYQEMWDEFYQKDPDYDSTENPNGTGTNLRNEKMDIQLLLSITGQKKTLQKNMRRSSPKKRL